MKKYFLTGSCALLLVLVGSGCTPNQPSIDQPSATTPSVDNTAKSPADLSATDCPDPPNCTGFITASSEPTQPKILPQPPTSTVMQKDTSPLKFPGVLPASEVNKKIRIKTTLGDIVIQLMADQGPNAASNFIYLVKRGFYAGTIFHRVIPGFMIQGGDPTGTGRGGPGYQFPNDQVKSPYNDGMVAMANAGRDTNGSQFFIMVADYPLPPDYSIFGKVVSGLEVAHKISQTARDSSDRPSQEVKMISVTVEP